MKLFIFLLALFACSVAMAQAPMNASLDWSEPTEYTDGNPIADGDITGYTVRCGNVLGDYPWVMKTDGDTRSISKESLIAQNVVVAGVPTYCVVATTTANGLTGPNSEPIYFVVPVVLPEDRKAKAGTLTVQ